MLDYKTLLWRLKCTLHSMKIKYRTNNRVGLAKPMSGVVKPNAVKGQLHNPSLGSESESVENSSSAAIRVENHTDSSNRVDTTSNSETNEGVVKPNAVKGQLQSIFRFRK